MIMTIDNEPLKGSEPISATVERVWRQIGMDRLSPAEQERFLAAETERIEDLIEVRVPDQIELTRLYRQQSGQQPDYLTTVGLINNARNQATAAVIEEELFSQLPDDEEDEEPPMLTVEEQAERREREDSARRAAHRHEPDRWKRALHRSEPTEQIVALVKALWGQRGPRFRVTAQYLLQALQEDGQPIPQHRDSDLYQSCTRLLEAEMIARGFAADGTVRR